MDGRIEALMDSQGRMFDYLYDASGERLVSVIEPDSVKTDYIYNAVTGQPSDYALTEIAFPGGTHRFYGYDARGRLVSESRDGGAEALTYSYTAPCEIRTTNADSAVSGIFYGFAGQPDESYDQLGRFTSFSYDQHVRLGSIRAPSGATTLLAYDAAGNARVIVDPLGNSVVLGHVPGLGRLDWLRDQKGNITEYTVDSSGDTTVITPADLTTKLFTYDSASKITSMTNRRGGTISYAYDTEDRLSLKTYPGGRTITYSYDTRSNLTSAADSLTGAILMEYDARDQLTRIEYPGGEWFTLVYADDGRRTQRVGHDGFTSKSETWQ